MAAAEGKDRLAELFAQTHAASQAKVAELLAKTQATNEEILKHLILTRETRNRRIGGRSRLEMDFGDSGGRGWRGEKLIP